MKFKTKIFLCIIVLSLFALPVFAAGGEEVNVTERMTELVLQIGIILFAAKIGGFLMKKINMPSVLGELITGIIIGPYFLGSIKMLGFPLGIFPIASPAFPVSIELYGIATIASIILLFLSGLETDLDLFLSFSLKGAVIGIGGVVFSFLAGAGAGMYFLHVPFMDARSLFLGVLSIATSVGITARILSEQKKMDSPEGVTILAAAVIDDVLGIIILAIVLGIVSVLSSGSGQASVDWKGIGFIAFKAIAVWLGFTAIGLVFAHKISRFLKIFKTRTAIAIMSFGIALLISGFFEKAGLAMIIGAYVMGLALSKTDLNFVIQEKLRPLHDFFVPVFFCVMGMLVDVKVFAKPEVLIMGIIYSLVCIIAKIIGCGLPSMFLNFNLLGASRIGVGMVPRGEVALIIAGIGISSGILDDNLFGVAVLMTLITTLFPPPLLSFLLGIKKRGTRTEMKGTSSVLSDFVFPSIEMTNLASSGILGMVESEGFYVQGMETDNGFLYQIRKDDVFISLKTSPEKLEFSSDPSDVSYVKTVVYESLLNIHQTFDKLKNIAKPEDLKKEISETSETSVKKNILLKQINPECITVDLKASNKEEVIKELVDILDDQYKLNNKDQVLKSVFEREETMSTGMQHGIALPHGKSEGVNKLYAAIGINKKGIDFQSIDGNVSKIFILVVSPLNATGPHIQFLSSISGILNSEETRSKILECSEPEEIHKILAEGI